MGHSIITQDKPIYFVDTNVLLQNIDFIKNEKQFYISSETLKELEEIKINKSKAENIKYRAREAVRFLKNFPEKYKTVIYDKRIACDFSKYYLDDSPDNRIIKCAEYVYHIEGIKNLVFVTNDILSYLIAKHYFKLNVVSMENESVDYYKGYIIKTLSDEELAYFYEHIDENQFDLFTNQYLILKNLQGETVNIFKWNSESHETVLSKPIKSKLLGTLKPLDDIQKCALDSIMNNDITVLYGRAGSGKTTLPLSYIVQGIEKGTFKKCYIVYSYEPLKVVKTLGYEKGDHITKLLLSASIGNILSSKFGDIQQVEYMIEKGTLDVIPTANIRGVEFEDDSCVLVTESQNLDVYTIKTIVQRCKDGCKQIYEGDIIEQKDVNLTESGIMRLIEVFKGHSKFGCVKLKNSYRGELTELADKL